MNPNGLGGTTLLFLPLALVLTLSRLCGTSSTAALPHAVRRWAPILRILGSAVVVLVVAFGLLVSQSRTAWLSAAVAMALVVALRFRSVSLFGLIGLGIALTIWYRSDWFVITRVVESDRWFFWSLGYQAFLERPIFGVGLGAFRRVAEVMQGGAITPVFVAHAHNTFLQVALDTGVLGLVAYVALLVVATRMAFGVLVRGTVEEQVLSVGLWASLVAIHIFGLADAIALGAKVGVFVWWNIGLIAALHHVSLSHRRRTTGCFS